MIIELGSSLSGASFKNGANAKSSAPSILTIVMVLLSYKTGQAGEFGDQVLLQWKAGVSKIDITPEDPIWLAGYGGRDHTSEEVIHPIWIKALALEDASAF